MKKIAIIGSTGSIGTTALDVVRKHLNDFKIVALSTNSNFEKLAEQANEFKPSIICVGNYENVQKIQSLLKYKPAIVFGSAGLIDVAANSGADILLSAVVGAVGLLPTIEAIKKGINIALANKETLVIGGEIITKLAQEKNVKLIPVDSEHNAIFQCLKGNEKRDLSRIILTASGGPFLNRPIDSLINVTKEEALNHPTWGMGKKISVDSATMVNKCLEIIEAKWLFELPIEKIDVVIHPQSIVHSMIEFCDGSIIAMLGPTSMSIPIAYSLYYPNYAPSCIVDRLCWDKVLNLTFMPPDTKRFPIIEIAKQVVREGGSMPAVLNAANEVAVQYFLDGRISFIRIVSIIQEVLQKHTITKHPDLDALLEADKWARNTAINLIEKRLL